MNDKQIMEAIKHLKGRPATLGFPSDGPALLTAIKVMEAWLAIPEELSRTTMLDMDKEIVAEAMAGLLNPPQTDLQKLRAYILDTLGHGAFTAGILDKIAELEAEKDTNNARSPSACALPCTMTHNPPARP